MRWIFRGVSDRVNSMSPDERKQAAAAYWDEQDARGRDLIAYEWSKNVHDLWYRPRPAAEHEQNMLFVGLIGVLVAFENARSHDQFDQRVQGVKSVLEASGYAYLGHTIDRYAGRLERKISAWDYWY